MAQDLDLAASGSSPNGAVTRIDFLGHYEGLNCEGDGAYLRWHGGLKQGALANHLGSTDASANKVVWDSSWVPDQREPMQIAARITDGTGLIVFTEPVGGLQLERPGFAVELCNPYDVPQAFTSCRYGVWITRGPRSERFKVGGEPARIVDARFALSCWNTPSSSGLSVNEVPLEEKRTNGSGWPCPLTLRNSPRVT